MDINIEKFLSANGQFVRAGFRTTKKPAAKFKGTILEKETVGLFTAGKNYANLKAVKEAIASGERGEVQKLPFGEWVTFPFIIKHTTKDNVENFYIRFYPDPKSRITVKYFVNQQQVEKEVFNSFLTPSDQKPNDSGVFVVKAENIISLCDTADDLQEAV